MKKIPLLFAGFGGALLAVLMGWASAFGNIESMQKSLAVMIALLMIALSLLTYCVNLLENYQNTTWHHGLLLLHAGLLIVLIAEGWDFFYGSKGMLFVREGTSTSVYFDTKNDPIDLSFSVFCQDFKTELYSNTQNVSAYKAILKLTDDHQEKEVEIAINRPLTHKGVDLYLQSSGIEPGNDAYIDLSVTDENAQEHYKTVIDAPLNLKSGVVLYIRDFSPSLAYQDEVFYTADPSVMKNPAYFVEMLRPNTPPVKQWVIVQNSDTHTMNGIRLTFHDFYGIEYAVISIVINHMKYITYLGLMLIVIGALILTRRRHDAL